MQQKVLAKGTMVIETLNQNDFVYIENLNRCKFVLLLSFFFPIIFLVHVPFFYAQNLPTIPLLLVESQ